MQQSAVWRGLIQGWKSARRTVLRAGTRGLVHITLGVLLHCPVRALKVGCKRNAGVCKVGCQSETHAQPPSFPWTGQHLQPFVQALMLSPQQALKTSTHGTSCLPLTLLVQHTTSKRSQSYVSESLVYNTGLVEGSGGQQQLQNELYRYIYRLLVFSRSVSLLAGSPGSVGPPSVQKLG